MNVALQELIHKFEHGTGSRVVRGIMVTLAMVALAVGYDLAAFRNLNTQEGMDAAQLGRNIADGKGYTTSFIRPLSLHLIYRRATNQLARMPAAVAGPGESAAPDEEEARWINRLQESHPDLANPPLYPLLLAGLWRLNPFGFPQLGPNEAFSIYKPDLWLALFNQVMLLAAAWLVFRLGRKMFDEPVGWVSAMLFAGSEIFWRFSVSGLSTMLLILIFLLLASVLWELETESRKENPQSGRLWRLALMSGLLLGAGSLTRYSFIWLVIPVGVFCGTLNYVKKGRLLASVFLVFLLILLPWLARNYHLSGTPFGTAGYAMFHGTASFPEDHMERSSNPDFREFSGMEVRDKAVANFREILESELPKMGGNWISAFFLVGLLVPFRNVSLARVRLFLGLSLLSLLFAQAIGETALTDASPQINSENLLILISPIIFIFGTSLFFVLLDQFGQHTANFRLSAMGIFCLLLSAPLLLRMMPPRPSPLVYPPYYPPWIQEKARLFDEDDLVMSDIPWAMAWYGGIQSVWLSLYYKDPFAGQFPNDFSEINDGVRPVHGLHCSAKTLKKVETDSLMNWVSMGEQAEAWEETIYDWPSFILVGIYLKNEVPQGFPLKNAPLGIFPELFLTDSEHIERKTIQSP